MSNISLLSELFFYAKLLSVLFVDFLSSWFKSELKIENEKEIRMEGKGVESKTE